MVRCHLARFMGQSKMKVTDVVKETAQKVDLEAIDKLCILFECGIGELFEQK